MYHSDVVNQYQVGENIVATDSEWDGPTGKWISTAFSNGANTIMFCNSEIPESVRERWARLAISNIIVRFVSMEDDMQLMRLAKKELNVGGKRQFLLNYFSPKDFEYSLGWTRWNKAIMDGRVRQKRNLSGNVGNAHIKDLSGWAGKFGLEEFAGGLGVEMASKGAFTKDDKANMWRTMLERPEDFLRYSVDDSRKLLECYSNFINLNRTIQGKIGMRNKDLWKENIPMTTGKLVATTLDQWLHRQTGELEEAFKFCKNKLGVLSPDRKKQQHKVKPWDSRKNWRSAKERYTNLDSLTHAIDDQDKGLADCMNANFDYTAMNSCGVRWWACQYGHTNSACFNALFQGGRCLNENPWQCAVDYCLDIDISGCYGEALRGVVFPVGLPSVWAWTSNEQHATFGQWLDANGSDLVDGMWCAVVNGELGFEQDLLYSKLVKAKDIARTAFKWNADEDGELNTDFVMMRKTLTNAIITSDMLQLIRGVATDKEWDSIRKLELQTAVAYKRSDRADSIAEWCETVLADRGEYKTGKNASIRDERTRAWVGMPLEGFVGTLADLRNEQQKVMDATPKASDEHNNAKALRTMLKLYVNTTYGDIASRFFSVGNTVVGNNITARARAGVWQVAKALGLRQTITDGGLYSPVAVPVFEGRKPGLNTLANLWTDKGGWKKNAGGQVLKWTGLGGLDWVGQWNELTSERQFYDDLALQHIKSFWKPYGLSFDQFGIRHKDEHTCRRAAYMGKADYAVMERQADGSTSFLPKLRGKEKKLKPGEVEHPKITLLRNIIEGRNEFPADMTYTRRGGLLKLGFYKLLQASNAYGEDLKRLRPGDALPNSTQFDRFNNTHFHIEDENMYLRRRMRKKYVRGKWQPLFEKFGGQGVQRVLQAMAEDTLKSMA